MELMFVGVMASVAAAAGYKISGVNGIEVGTVVPGNYGRKPLVRVGSVPLFGNGLYLEVSRKEVEASRAEGVPGRGRLTMKNPMASRPGCFRSVSEGGAG